PLAGARRPLPPSPTRRSSDLTGRPTRASGGDTPRAGTTRATTVGAVGNPPRTGDGGTPGLRLALVRQQRVLRRPSAGAASADWRDRKSTRLNSSHVKISYAVF